MIDPSDFGYFLDLRRIRCIAEGLEDEEDLSEFGDKSDFTNLDAEDFYWYAKRVIKGRWPDAEPFIMDNPKYAYFYARDIIKGRWPEAEPMIMVDPMYAYTYARDIIDGRWPEAESVILNSPYANSYKMYYLG